MKTDANEKQVPTDGHNHAVIDDVRVAGCPTCDASLKAEIDANSPRAQVVAGEKPTNSQLWESSTRERLPYLEYDPSKGPPAPTPSRTAPTMGRIVTVRSLDDGTECPAIVNAGVTVDAVVEKRSFGPEVVITPEGVFVNVTMFPAGQAVRYVEAVPFLDSKVNAMNAASVPAKLARPAKNGSVLGLPPADHRLDHRLVAFWPERALTPQDAQEWHGTSETSVAKERTKELAEERR